MCDQCDKYFAKMEREYPTFSNATIEDKERFGINKTVLPILIKKEGYNDSR